jgi:IS4 transposase
LVADRRVRIREGHLLRIVCHTDPVGGESYEFLTNVMDLPAGVVAELYRRRWEAEKVFDEIKQGRRMKKEVAEEMVIDPCVLGW